MVDPAKYIELNLFPVDPKLYTEFTVGIKDVEIAPLINPVGPMLPVTPDIP